MGRATEVLEREHRYIEKVTELMSSLGDELDRGKAVPADALRDVVTFLRIFAGQCHHAKEEEYLFKLLEQRGVPASGCPLGVMKAEHNSGHILLEKLAQAAADYITAPRQHREPLRDALRELVQHYQHHIWKEDFLVFPMAEELLSEADHAEIAAGYGAIEADIGSDVHHAFEGLVRILGPRAGECPVCGVTAA